MARPKCCRRISEQPACRVFKPAGVPFSIVEEIVLSMDEFEAIRLADLEGLYQEKAAERMNVSRQTFGGLSRLRDARWLKPYVTGLLFGSKEAKWKCRMSERSSVISAGTYGACRTARANLWNAPNAKVDLSVALKIMTPFPEAKETAKGSNAGVVCLERLSLSTFNRALCHGRAVGLIRAAPMMKKLNEEIKR